MYKRTKSSVLFVQKQTQDKFVDETMHNPSARKVEQKQKKRKLLPGVSMNEWRSLWIASLSALTQVGSMYTDVNWKTHASWDCEREKFAYYKDFEM